MKIKQTTFYVLKAIRRMYLEDSAIVTSTVIAEKEQISQGVTLRLLRRLEHAGFLHVHQGRGNSGGGFSLAKNIDEITLLDIVDLMEKVDICENLDEKSKREESTLFCKCIQINEHMKEELSKYTIQDLFEL